MHIQSINTNSPASKGLYFTRVPNVLFNKSPKVTYSNPVDVVKVSEQGARYIEDRMISEKMKERFKSNPFIKELSKKFDTFVFFRELPVGHSSNFGKQHLSFARISWADYAKSHSELRIAQGESPISTESATNNMFKNIEKKNFSEIG